MELSACLHYEPSNWFIYECQAAIIYALKIDKQQQHQHFRELLRNRVNGLSLLLSCKQSYLINGFSSGSALIIAIHVSSLFFFMILSHTHAYMHKHDESMLEKKVFFHLSLVTNRKADNKLHSIGTFLLLVVVYKLHSSRNHHQAATCDMV